MGDNDDCVNLLYEASRMVKEGLRQVPAVDELIRRYFPKVKLLLEREFKTLHENERDTALHDALLYFVKNPSRYNPSKSAFQTILAIAAMSRAKNEVVRQARMWARYGPLDAATLDLQLPSFDPTRGLEVAEEIEQLRALVDELGLDPVDAAILGFDPKNGNWAKQLGHRLDVDPNVISQRWNRLRTRIRDHAASKSHGGRHAGR